MRSHSNVQGDRTMGIYEKPADAFLDALAAEFGFAPPREPGLDTVDSIGAMDRGGSTCSSPSAATWPPPDTEVTARALEALRPHRAGLHQAQPIPRRGWPGIADPPCLGRTEAVVGGGVTPEVTVEDSMSMVHASVGTLEPASPHLRSGRWRSWPAWLGGCSGPTATSRGRAGPDHGAIRDRIEAVVPGFTAFNQRIEIPRRLRPAAPAATPASSARPTRRAT
ncbi:MAG: hypothetical protein R2711_17925 [Acidimicrobiales bacterium]